MAGTCVEKLVHKGCTKSKNKTLQVFLNEDGTYTGTCFACGAFVKNPYEDGKAPEAGTVKVKTPEEILEEINDVKSCKLFDMEHRAIVPEHWKHAGVRLVLSEYDGVTPNALAHPYTKGGKLVGYKLKLLKKKIMWQVGDTKGADLYNWERAKKIGGKNLFICEGEEDAIALRQILITLNKGTAYESLDYACVSLPRGVKDAKDTIGRQLDEIERRFENVVLVFDDDESGKMATREVKKILPKAKVVTLPCNDANQCLKEGKLRATRDAVMFRQAVDLPVKLSIFDELIEDALKPVEWGYSYPWESLNGMTYGLRKDGREVIGIGGGTGSGKTLLGHELIAHMGMTHGLYTFAMFLEESNIESVKNITGKLASVPYHVPDTEYDDEEFRTYARKIGQYVELWNPDDSVSATDDWNTVKKLIRSQPDKYDLFLLDNITAMTEELSATERNEFIGRMLKDATELSEKFNIKFVFISHLNAPDRQSRPHELGGVVKESQFTGSRAMQRYCTVMIGFERNKNAVDPNCSVIRCLKNRRFGRTGFFKTYYTGTTGRLKERSWEDDLYADKNVTAKKS